MTDKFRRTHPLNIVVAAGEAPTGAKLTAIASQARTGARVLEKAVGDLWNQSGDTVLSDWPLQLPNLARVVGENKWLNPVLYPVSQSFTYRDNVGTKFQYQTRGYLQFKPSTFASASAVSGSTNLTNKVATKALVLAAGDWTVDVEDGEFFSFSALATTDKIDYTVDSSTWAVTDATVPGVIPDPRQTEFTSCRLSTALGLYYIHLPPRRPLTLTGFDRPDRYPPTTDVADNEATSISPYKLWQSETTALADAHYRYYFPKEIDDIIASLSTGADIPEGFLYLWNQDTNTIVEDATFRKSSLGNWVLEFTAPSQNLASKVSTNENAASYNSTKYSIITVGSPLARSVYTLNKVLLSGAHGNTGDLGSLISHSSLLNQNPPNSSYPGHSSTYPTTVPAWAPSRWEMDDHVSLLSRAGSQGISGGRYRDANDNAMLGDLLMGSVEAVSGTYVNTTYTTNKIAFGNTTGAYLYGKAGGEMISTLSTLGVGTLAAPTGIAVSWNLLYGDMGSGTFNMYMVGLDINGNPGALSAKYTESWGPGEDTFYPSCTALDGATGYIVYVQIPEFDSLYRVYNRAGAPTMADQSWGDILLGWFGGTLTEAEIIALYPANKDMSTMMQLDAASNSILNKVKFGGNNAQIIMLNATSNSESNSAVSHPIYFGSSSTGAKLTGLSGALYITPGSSGAPPLMLVNQSTDPGSVLSGGIYAHNSGKIRTANGTSWDRVVSQSASITANSTAITSAAETQFDQFYTIPASTLVVGSTIRVVATGVTTVNGSNMILTLKLRIGNSAVGIGTRPAILTQVPSGTGPVANQNWMIDAYLTIRSIGSGGTGIGAGIVATTASDIQVKGTGSSAITINTTITNIVSVTGLWSGTTGSPSTRLETLVIDVQ